MKTTTKKKKIRVRFNLSRGSNYIKWKLQYPGGKVRYYNPDEVQLIMRDCELKNHKKAAQKIFKGSNKTVCAWVIAQKVEIRKTRFSRWDLICDRIKYNPRIQPNWMLNGHEVDDQHFEIIASFGSCLYRVR